MNFGIFVTRPAPFSSSGLQNDISSTMGENPLGCAAEQNLAYRAMPVGTHNQDIHSTRCY
jgi:hypothetical protein